jgi:hypothetical protein
LSSRAFLKVFLGLMMLAPLMTGTALADQNASEFNRPIGKEVPLTGPLTPVPPTAGTDIPLYKPNCSWRSEMYHHPVKGWISRRVQVCR